METDSNSKSSEYKISDNLLSTIDKNEDFQEAVNLFYTLKGQYEEKLQDLRRTIAKKPNLSNKEKRDEFKKFYEYFDLTLLEVDLPESAGVRIYIVAEAKDSVSGSWGATSQEPEHESWGKVRLVKSSLERALFGILAKHFSKFCSDVVR